MKKCSKCKKIKENKYFSKDKNRKDGLCHYCRECKKINYMRWRRNIDDCKGYDSNHYFKYRKKILINKREYYNRNRKLIITKNSIYRFNHRDDRNKRTRERLKSDYKFKLRRNISSLINTKLKRRLLNKNTKSTFSFLPYTLGELMNHLEKQFKYRMSWNNYGKWHIHHIIPDCNFIYKSVKDKEFFKCWSLDNLQPLWAKDNLRKNKKICIM